MPYSVHDHGSIAIVQFDSVEERDEVLAECGDETMTWGPAGIVVEPRYLESFLAALDGADFRP